ncbi:hypothetical protein [Mesoterricola silvestris]|uniref:DUF3142 domain-containing protein n=1 Tax=Mesoterricola silvestris TaxID=2927979 RepID=A0AA48KAI1_9BACT|nr:hypothetical protein [Mesoterricola silvestris]BDU74676.1 hypothetical protein METEAL_38500 [Mesoterricola silvestris]
MLLKKTNLFSRLSAPILCALSLALEAGVPASSPRVWVWAWDRPEDLRFLKPEEAGVAFFVLGIQVGPGTVAVRPRTAPLRLPEGMHRIAVVRLEASGAGVPERRMTEILAAIRTYALVPGIEGLQIDFDASLSQRPFYRQLIDRLLKPGEIQVPLTITALASWCMGDPWIRDLPVSGAVGMFFQMGRDTPEALAWLRKHRPVTGVRPGALAWGLATDQPLPVAPPPEARVFLFHPRSWTPDAFSSALRRVTP